MTILPGVDVAISGIRAIPLTAHADDRGSLMEVYRHDWFADPPPVVQANLSVSRAGVLRGLHYHRRQTDYWCPVDGRAFIGLFDLRAGSPTHGQASSFRMDASGSPGCLVIPPGVAHGFLAETDLRLLYLVDVAFSGEDEHGIAWDDSDLGISWPAPSPILSTRDRSNPPLAAALVDPPSWVDPGASNA